MAERAAEIDPQLAELVERWPALSADKRACLLAVLNAGVSVGADDR